jgi:hypothetical protein
MPANHVLYNHVRQAVGLELFEDALPEQGSRFMDGLTV